MKDSPDRPDFPRLLAAYRLLLCVYPAWFRRRYADEMAETLRRRCVEVADERGRAALARLLLAAGWDALSGGLSERVASSPHRRSPTRGKVREAMTTTIQDVRYGIRMLAKSPGTTAAIVLSLALGIGANVTIFSFVDALFFDSLAVADADRVAVVYSSSSRPGDSTAGGLQGYLPMSYPNFEDIRDRTETFREVAAYSFQSFNLAEGGEPEQVPGRIVSASYFDVLGVEPVLGRGFLPEEDEPPGSGPVVVLSHRLWTRRFGADAEIVGRDIAMNGRAFTVVGVAPQGFTGTSSLFRPDVWVPMSLFPQVSAFADRFDHRGMRVFLMVGRLAPGATMARAGAELATIGKRLAADHPRWNEGYGFRPVPLNEQSINPNLREIFVDSGILLMAVVAVVLLIACANVANLLLSRAAVRRKEMAIRQSLGAGRGRLVRQMLTETVMLFLVGGGVGFLLSFWGRDLLWALRPPFLAGAGLQLELDATVLAFSVLLTLTSAVAFGLVPALRAIRSEPVGELKDRAASEAGVRGLWNARSLLVAGQVALCLVAMVGAGLFLRSLERARQIDPGFEVEGLLLASYDLGAQGYSEEEGRRFHRRVVEEVGALPGVESAVLAQYRPLQPGIIRRVVVEGREATSRGAGDGGDDAVPDGILIQANPVSEGYFETLGIPLLRGRAFTGADRADSRPVAVVNETMAERLWPGDEAMGKRFRFTFAGSPWIEVVGVAADGKYFTLGEESQPFYYLPLRQHHAAQATLHVRTATAPSALAPQLRSTVRELEPGLPLVDLEPADVTLEEALWAPRMGAILLAVFGAVALALASVGVYGVLSTSVRRRTREMGIRIALGAQGRDVLRMVVGRAMMLIGAGLAVGLAASLALARWLSGFLYGVSVTDPTTYAVVVAFIVVVGFVAAVLPARRATRVDPLVALRAD